MLRAREVTEAAFAQAKAALASHARMTGVSETVNVPEIGRNKLSCTVRRDPEFTLILIPPRILLRKHQRTF